VNKDWIDISVLEDYLEGKLDAKAMNRVEREALEDPFVAEALAGLSESPRRSLDAMSLLQKQLRERVSEQQVYKKRSLITWQRLSIAATAAVMFISVSVIFWMREDNRRKELAALPKKVDVNLAPRKENNAPIVASAVPAVENKDSLAADRTAVVIDRAIQASKKETYASLKKKPNVPSPSAPQDVSLNEVAIVGYKAEGKRAVAYSSSRLVMPDSSKHLNEVAVTSFGRSPDTNISKALAGKVAGVQTEKKNIMIRGMASASSVSGAFSPVGGWDKFREYLKKKNRFSNEAKTGKSVVLSFNLDKKGKPENIKVLMGIAEKYDLEAVRLLQKGPKWNASEAQDKQLFVNIDF